jgi:hypothetical protein
MAQHQLLNKYAIEHSSDIFFICIVGCGVQLGPLGTATTDWPIVPALDGYDDGEIGGINDRGN